MGILQVKQKKKERKRKSHIILTLSKHSVEKWPKILLKTFKKIFKVYLAAIFQQYVCMKALNFS